MKLAALSPLVAFAVWFCSACSAGGGNSSFNSRNSGTAGSGGTSSFDPGGGLNTGGASSMGLTVSSGSGSIDVTTGSPVPTVQLSASAGGQSVSATWSVDRPDIGSIDDKGVLTPTGAVGGRVVVTAASNGAIGTTIVEIHVHLTQNGVSVGTLGGVGGEGAGAPVSSAVLQTLQGASNAEPGLSWLYPYDQTVWPRGIPAPLMQWQSGPHAYDAVRIHVVEKYFEYTGYFAATATPFAHHPLTDTAWNGLTFSNQGNEAVTVELIFSSGGGAFGPISQTWKVAPGTLKGVVYYNSYGTTLAKSSTGVVTAWGSSFGAATLAIRGASTAPAVVVGQNNCRVCHSVAENGQGLVTQQGTQNSYRQSSYFDLKSNAEASLGMDDGHFVFPAIYPDGSMLLSSSGDDGTMSADPSALYSLPSGMRLSAQVPAGLRARFPTFSPDGKHTAFNFLGGAGADGKTLAVMTFNAVNRTFDAPSALATPAKGTAVWPAFLPTNDALVFEVELSPSGYGVGETRGQGCNSAGRCDSEAHGELWRVDLATRIATRLDRLNGVGYLPTLGTAHDDDSTLNYEPTVSPIPSGGYAWVVFTSRRLYGNVATVGPYNSDPRSSTALQTQPTTKKLWVAAVDLTAPDGTDPSHPAFYLPSQELLAGNSRGYWVVDPCAVDGATCETGDECCGGYCRADSSGKAVCGKVTSTCANEYERCTTAADCCHGGSLDCINSYCSLPTVR